jgi:ParB family transcriptional regulator, chromosome partitioning protein
MSARRERLAAFDDRPEICDPTEIAFAEAFISIDDNGGVPVQRGYVRPEDESAKANGQDGAETHRQTGVANGSRQR